MSRLLNADAITALQKSQLAIKVLIDITNIKTSLNNPELLNFTINTLEQTIDDLINIKRIIE